MDIQNLKGECNSLIDEVIRLQEKEKVLDEKISMLQEEIQGLASGKVNEESAGKTDERLPEELEHTEAEMGEPIEPAKPEEPAICEKEEPAPETEETSEPETSEPLKKKEEMPQGRQNRLAGEDKDCREEIFPSGESPGLLQEEEKRLARQVSLLTGENGKEIVIVYERPDGLQKVKDLLKTVIFILLMLFIVAAAVLLLYCGVEKGVVQEYVF